MTEQLFSELFAKRPDVIKPGLARIERALAHLGEKHFLDYPVILVAGTNGKGSVSSYLWQLLTARGWRVGLFTSPHLVSFTERFFSDRGMISEAELLSLWQELKAQLGQQLYDELSFFEINTLLAFRYFKILNVDYAICEVGLGGRFDATNVASPVLSVITSIGLDHQQFLGPTTLDIAREKAGIMRPNTPVLLGGEKAIDPEALAWSRGEAHRLNADCFEVSRDACPSIDRVKIGAMEFPLPPQLSGAPEFLKRNFALALLALRTLCGEKALAVQPELPKVRPPALGARFQRLPPPPELPLCEGLILDVCHNTHGAFALKSALLERDKPVNALISILADKDVNEVLDILRSTVTIVGLFPVPTERTWSRQDLDPRHHDLPFFQDFHQAWHGIKQVSGELLITGSVYAVGWVAETLGVVDRLYGRRQSDV